MNLAIEFFASVLHAMLYQVSFCDGLRVSRYGYRERSVGKSDILLLLKSIVSLTPDLSGYPSDLQTGREAEEVPRSVNSCCDQPQLDINFGLATV